ncbi:ATP-binding cassette domain-containing protein [Gordonia sp. HY002]|uniref:sulfate/molybdate ABC transporter ATP-binding protein n=1 Tax=Gordonia zhenghanii TaxID=2911516 RepID=UPI001EF0EF10|nr:ATP-binding cassette domain-containing protein [Gordonia zhenghanii]MCF8571769.1 ATP-binding cassette domain-containing protein [Gordonia zhenghanii]MCF8604906.1 ATP-binding cassette domain-containing protein [Gordonia zhenghanii]
MTQTQQARLARRGEIRSDPTRIHRGGRLSADVTVARAEFDVTARFDVDAGGCVALLGPNGSGKSTVLAALAGLVRLRAGTVAVDGETIDETGGVRLPPEARRIALLDQRARLFPHLTIERNIAFGPRARGLDRGRVRASVADWLDRIGLTDRAQAKPHELSGGQQQRVAIARAFASQPRVLLLDEPFAALDAESAPIVRRILSDELACTGTTSVLVTHEMSDAWQWADTCLVMNRGTVVETGTPSDLAVRPRGTFTAALAGFDVVRGRWRAGGLGKTGGLEVENALLSGVSDGDLHGGNLHGGDLHDGDRAIGIVAPRDVVLEAASADHGLDGGADVLTSVSVQAGVVRVGIGSGLHAELPIDEALRVGDGSLPRTGDRYRLTPRRMRVVGAGDRF